MAPQDHPEDGPFRDSFSTDTDTFGHNDRDSVRVDVPGQPRRALRPVTTSPECQPEASDSPLGQARPLSGRRGVPSGRGSPDGGALRQACGRSDLERPHFGLQVAPNGYAWWYIDGISDDHSRAISIIAFIGSVFSPWYRWSGRRDPHNHVCINVATYGRGGRFTMTDRGRSALRQSASCFEVGPSALRWQNDKLIIDINEIGAPPLVSRVQGRITLTPEAITGVELPLTDDGAHIWRPFAPRARIDVDIQSPGWQWEGEGYFDANFGTRALEEDFSYWTWSRFPTARGATCFYDAERLDGSTLNAAFAFDRLGNARTIAAPPKARLPRPLWMVRRDTRADAGYQPRQVRTMLDAPFYNRCAVRTRLAGEEVTGIYEALDLTRFRQPWLKPMIALRVPRRPSWRFD